MAFKDNGK